MIEIVQLPGTDAELYRLVAPLVMNPKVLKQNLNYPFRTSEKFIWFVAKKEEEVVGFVPVECKRAELVINNYYIQGKSAEILTLLLEAVIEAFSEEAELASVTFVEDAETFASLGFGIEKKWTKYVRMKRAQVTSQKA